MRWGILKLQAEISINLIPEFIYVVWIYFDPSTDLNRVDTRASEDELLPKFIALKMLIDFWFIFVFGANIHVFFYS